MGEREFLAPVTAHAIDEASDTKSTFVQLKARRAAGALLRTQGLGVSMDEIAVASGIGRRTLFRHFASRDKLIGAALEDAFRFYEADLVAAIDLEGPLGEWLRRIVRHMHDTHLRAGRGTWELACAFDDTHPPEFAQANRLRRGMRRRVTKLLAQRGWELSGGVGKPPILVVDAFGLALSSYATHSMIIDARRRVDAVTETSASMLESVIRQALASDLSPKALSTVRESGESSSLVR